MDMLLTMISAISGSVSTKDFSMSCGIVSQREDVSGAKSTYILVGLRESIGADWKGTHLVVSRYDFRRSFDRGRREMNEKGDGEQEPLKKLRSSLHWLGKSYLHGLHSAWARLISPRLKLPHLLPPEWQPRPPSGTGLHRYAVELEPELRLLSASSGWNFRRLIRAC